MGDSAPDEYLAVVLTIVIVGAVALVLVAGFWWTRGSGPGAGSIFSPGRQELTKYTRLGGRMPEAGEDVDRDRE
jgi:hypothetical protein